MTFDVDIYLFIFRIIKTLLAFQMKLMLPRFLLLQHPFPHSEKYTFPCSLSHSTKILTIIQCILVLPTLPLALLPHPS